MMKFGNLVIAGIVTGSIYAVFAVCVAVWYRVCNILNLAVGDFAMVGALGSVVTRASGLALAVATIMLPLIATGYVSSAGYLGGSVGMPLSGNLWQASSPEAIALGNGVITVLALGVVVFIASRILHSDIGLELHARRRVHQR
jgi:ABC-type branched-subunit amino acid transport system permease subunit